MEEDLTKLSLEELSDRCNNYIMKFAKDNSIPITDGFQNFCESIKTIGKLEMLDQYKEDINSIVWEDKETKKFLDKSIESHKEDICYPNSEFSSE